MSPPRVDRATVSIRPSLPWCHAPPTWQVEAVDGELVAFAPGDPRTRVEHVSLVQYIDPVEGAIFNCKWKTASSPQAAFVQPSVASIVASIQGLLSYGCWVFACD